MVGFEFRVLGFGLGERRSNTQNVGGELGFFAPTSPNRACGRYCPPSPSLRKAASASDCIAKRKSRPASRRLGGGWRRLAEGVRFELTVSFHPRQFSRLEP